MHVIEVVKYNKTAYNDLFIDLKFSLENYFDDQLEVKEWISIYINSLKKISERKISLQIKENNDVIGFLIALIRDNEIVIRHFYIMNGYDRFLLSESIFNHLYSIYSIKYKDKEITNFAFTFPEDYITHSIENLGYKTLQRVNLYKMLENDSNVTEQNKMNDLYQIGRITGSMLNDLSQIGYESYKNSIDLSIRSELWNSKDYLNEIVDSWESYIDKNCSMVIYEKMNKKIIGYCLIETGDPEEAIIQDIVIQKSHRNIGLGSALLFNVISTCKKNDYKKIILTVTKKNSTACYIYRKIGFKKYNQFPDIILEKDTLDILPNNYESV